MGECSLVLRRTKSNFLLFETVLGEVRTVKLSNRHWGRLLLTTIWFGGFVLVR